MTRFLDQETSYPHAAVVEQQLLEVLNYPEHEQWLQAEPEVTTEVVYGFSKDTYEHQAYAASNRYYEEMLERQRAQLAELERKREWDALPPEEKERRQKEQMRRMLSLGENTDGPTD